MGIPVLKIRRSRDRLIFNMGIPIIMVRRHLYMETGPSAVYTYTATYGNRTWRWALGYQQSRYWKAHDWLLKAIGNVIFITMFYCSHEHEYSHYFMAYFARITGDAQLGSTEWQLLVYSRRFLLSWKRMRSVTLMTWSQVWTLEATAPVQLHHFKSYLSNLAVETHWGVDTNLQIYWFRLPHAQHWLLRESAGLRPCGHGVQWLPPGECLSVSVKLPRGSFPGYSPNAIRLVVHTIPITTKALPREPPHGRSPCQAII